MSTPAARNTATTAGTSATRSEWVFPPKRSPGQWSDRENALAPLRFARGGAFYFFENYIDSVCRVLTLFDMTTEANIYDASSQWAQRPADERYQTLDQLHTAVRSRRARSRASDVDLPDVRATFDPARGLTFNGRISPVTPTHWSFGQFAGLLGAPAGYLRSLPGDLLCQNFNHGLEHANRETVKFMTIAPEADGNGTLQAVTSPTYGRIWDCDCIESVIRIVERSNGKFHNPLALSRSGGAPEPSGLYASDHDCFVFMVDGGSILEAGPRAELNRGFILWNSETGARTMGLMTFLFNKVCGNHIIWGASQVNKLLIRHSKGGPLRFDNEAMPTLQGYINAPVAPELDAIRKAQDFLLPRSLDGTGTDMDGLYSLVEPFKLTRPETREAVESAKREEGDCRSLWQLVQGFTAYARGFDFIDSRVDLETRAGRLLNLTA